jgi:beta-xylosidase
MIVINTNSFGQQLVMRGDHPDPSVVLVGDTYWASATTSNWLPAFPILSSKDLVNWESKGFVFTEKPDWADYYFWAPEISYDNGKVYIYYSAHKKNGNLCLGVASADKPEGPYKDHGPLICQEAGSIDGFPMRDENGKLYIIWKEDGNSVRKPTPIWAQQINEERTALIGEKVELFRNVAGWEGNLVEGVSMLKIGEYIYAFYAAAGCCGTGCTYQTGVARAKNLLGPWEKYDKNPILTNEQEWKCPGHGTPVVKNGRYYFLYHAYDKESNIYTGRQGILKEFTTTEDGWIKFVPSEDNDIPVTSFVDKFKGRTLHNNWQWSVFNSPVLSQKGGRMTLRSGTLPAGSFIGTKTISGNYTATVKINTRSGTAAAGIGSIGDDENAIMLLSDANALTIIQVKSGKATETHRYAVTKTKNKYLQMQVTGGRNIRFLYSDSGKEFKPLNEQTIDGAYLPPWDRALRVGLISRGAPSNRAVFDEFSLITKSISSSEHSN